MVAAVSDPPAVRIHLADERRLLPVGHDLVLVHEVVGGPALGIAKLLLRIFGCVEPPRVKQRESGPTNGARSLRGNAHNRHVRRMTLDRRRSIVAFGRRGLVRPPGRPGCRFRRRVGRGRFVGQQQNLVEAGLAEPVRAVLAPDQEPAFLIFRFFEANGTGGGGHCPASAVLTSIELTVNNCAVTVTANRQQQRVG
jgi:hypothetical protein